MAPRLIILIVLAAGLAVFFAVRMSAPAKPAKDVAFDDGMSEAERQRIREAQKQLRDRTLPGKEPDVPPDLAIRVQVNPGDKKNRLHYNITEAHGYYVETFEIEFYYKPKPDTTADDSPLTFTHFANEFLPAKGTLSSCIEVVPAELGDVGGNIGTTQNWGANIVSYGRSRMQNPDPLPQLDRVINCD